MRRDDGLLSACELEIPLTQGSGCVEAKCGRTICDAHASFQNSDDCFLFAGVHIELSANGHDLRGAGGHAERALRILSDLKDCFTAEELHIPVLCCESCSHPGAGIELHH